MTEENLNNKDEKKIYIIDNYGANFPTDRIKRLIEIFERGILNENVEVIRYTQINLKHIESSKGLILSGSNINVSEFYKNRSLRRKFKIVLKIIKKAKTIPIFAICYGLHLTGFAFKGKVKRIPTPIKGGRTIPISLMKSDKLIPYKQLTVDIQHRDFISPNDASIIKQFEILATKEIEGFETIQYMRHKKRPIYSVQFHPETHLASYYNQNQDDEDLIKEIRNIGEEIIENFVNFCTQ